MNRFKKGIIKLMCISLLLSTFTVAPKAEENSGNIISRVSVSVNGDTASSRGLCWYTDEECPSIVKVYKNNIDVTNNVDISNIVCEQFEGKYMHKATISNLESGTTYEYSVSNGIDEISGKFTTDDKDDKLNFIAIADVQASNDHNFKKGARVLNKAIEMMPDSDFVANLGDFTNDCDNKQWDYYYDNFQDSSLKTTIAPVAGNHDGFAAWHWFDNMFNLDTSESVQNLNGVNYSFDYGNAHFTVLNTNDLAAVSNAQLKWLKNDINSSDKDWRIVFMHKSPYTLGKDGKWPDATYVKDAALKIFDECNVDLVMSGHDHMYLRTKPLINNSIHPAGTTYVLSGTAGAKRYEIRSFLANSFLDTRLIDNLIIQEKDYANYWDGEDWNQSDTDNVGGCFNTVSIEGGKLTLNSYILRDELNEDGSDHLKKTDTFEVSKKTGENKKTFDGVNKISKMEYALGIAPTIFNMAKYVFTKWLPRFIIILPSIIRSYIVDGIF